MCQPVSFVPSSPLKSDAFEPVAMIWYCSSSFCQR